jgi:ankyrin repeat protein
LKMIDGMPGSRTWNPPAQAATVAHLIAAGADPNATDKSGVTPLHRAVRTRCAIAVKALLEAGARRKNKSGSTPMLLATQNTGRGGSGSSEAKAQQELIVQLLREHINRQI